ncbi:hypothetical protein QEN19_003559 [Hanseniaspora menglaensis]
MDSHIEYPPGSFNFNNQKILSSLKRTSYPGNSQNSLKISNTPTKNSNISKNCLDINETPKTFILPTPPTSFGKKILSSIKKTKSSIIFQHQNKNDSTSTVNKKIPEPLNLSSSKNTISYCGYDESSLYVKNLENKNKNKTTQKNSKINVQEFSFLKDAKKKLEFHESSKKVDSLGIRKNYSTSNCVVCNESLRISLNGEKIMTMENGTLVHQNCYCIHKEKQILQNDSDMILKTSDSTNSVQHREAFKNYGLPKKPLPLSKLTTPVDQFVKSEAISENGFQKNNIKKLHQNFKKLNVLNNALEFDLSILPQFYKIELTESLKPMLLPYVVQLKKSYDPNYLNPENKKELHLKVDILKEEETKKKITDAFFSVFLNFFTELKFKYNSNKIVIEMIDFIEVSSNEEIYKPCIVLLLSNIDYLVFMSIDGKNNCAIELNLLYKIIRLENIALIYSKSLEYPEISLKLPATSFVDTYKILDKWENFLNLKLLNKSSPIHLNYFTSNIFDVIDQHNCSISVLNFVNLLKDLIPEKLYKKIINNKNHNQINNMMLTPLLDLSENTNLSQANKFGSVNKSLQVICFVINAYTGVEETLKEMLKKLGPNWLVGFIISNGNFTFKYIGFLDSKWEELDAVTKNIFAEKDKFNVDNLNADNMFNKIDELITINGLPKASIVEVKIFNNKDTFNIKKLSKSTLFKYENLSIEEYCLDKSNIGLETYMEEEYQFTNRYTKFTINEVTETNKNIICNNFSKGKMVKVDFFINPDFQDCVSFKNLENAFGHKVFIENYKNIKSIQFSIKNEKEIKLIIFELEVTYMTKLIEKIQSFENIFSGFDKTHSLIFYTIENNSEVFESQEVNFNIEKKPANFKNTYFNSVQNELNAEAYLDTDSGSISSNSSTIDIFITTPITSNKEPLYLLRDIELQLITIIEEIFINNKNNNNNNANIEIINYYYTIFFSYSKNVDIKAHANLNFNYTNIIEYIDCLFDILLSCKYDKILLLYDMLRYQHRNDIKSIRYTIDNK